MSQSKLMQHQEAMQASGFFLYPVIELEDQFEPSTDEHVARQKETGKFLKKLGKNTPAFDNLWELALSINASFKDLSFIEKTTITTRSLESISEVYATYDLDTQNFKKALKKVEKSHPDVFSYYDVHRDLFDINVFELYAEDMKYHYENTQKNLQDYCEKYNRDEKLEVSYEDVLGYYKTALKKIKEERKKKNS